MLCLHYYIVQHTNTHDMKTECQNIYIYDVSDDGGERCVQEMENAVETSELSIDKLSFVAEHKFYVFAQIRERAKVRGGRDGDNDTSPTPTSIFSQHTMT